MKPGRELDALIAERVMGVRKASYGCPTCEYEGLYGRSEYPAYSTDIAAAWEVVEKLRVAASVLRFGDGSYSVSFHQMGRRKLVMGEAESKTAPHAICLAALKAVGA